MFGATGKVIQGTGGKRNMDIAAREHIARLASPSFLLQHAVNRLVVGLKVDGIWNKIDVLCVHPSTTSTESLYDLKGVQDSTTYQSPTHSSLGWDVGLAKGSIDTQRSSIDSPLMNSNDSHIMTYYNTPLTLGMLAGAGTNSSTQYSFEYNAGTVTLGNIAYLGAEWISGLSAELTIANPVGFFVGSLLSGTAATRVNDAEATVTGSVAGSNDSSPPIYVGNMNGGFPKPLDPYARCTAWAIGGGLTSSERANYYTHIQEYMVTMGLEA